MNQQLQEEDLGNLNDQELKDFRKMSAMGQLPDAKHQAYFKKLMQKILQPTTLTINNEEKLRKILARHRIPKITVEDIVQLFHMIKDVDAKAPDADEPMSKKSTSFATRFTERHQPLDGVEYIATDHLILIERIRIALRLYNVSVFDGTDVPNASIMEDETYEDIMKDPVLKKKLRGPLPQRKTQTAQKRTQTPAKKTTQTAQKRVQTPAKKSQTKKLPSPTGVKTVFPKNRTPPMSPISQYRQTPPSTPRAKKTTTTTRKSKAAPKPKAPTGSTKCLVHGTTDAEAFVKKLFTPTELNRLDKGDALVELSSGSETWRPARTNTDRSKLLRDTDVKRSLVLPENSSASAALIVVGMRIHKSPAFKKIMAADSRTSARKALMASKTAVCPFYKTTKNANPMLTLLVR